MIRQKFVGHSGVSGEGAPARSKRDVGQYFFPRWSSFFPMGLLEGPEEGPEMAFLRGREVIRGPYFLFSFNRAKASGFVGLFAL